MQPYWKTPPTFYDLTSKPEDPPIYLSVVHDQQAGMLNSPASAAVAEALAELPKVASQVRSRRRTVKKPA